MRYFLFLLLVAPQLLFAQIPTVKKPVNCWEKGKSREGKRYAEWECGKVAGIVDCNEKLELDPATNTVLTATQHSPFSGTCETCHGNGTIERRVTFVNGKTNGKDTTTYPSGCPMVIRDHVMGEENGQWLYWYDSTGYEGKERLAWEMNYSVGELNGKQVYFNKKGDTTKLEHYQNGVLNGSKVTYDSRGKRIKVTNYVNGLLEGPYLVYNPAGKIIEDLSYKQGKKNGVLKYYYDDGTLLRTENWDMDARNGEFKTLYYEQNIQTIENYKKSNGKSTSYYSGKVYHCPTKEIAEKVKEISFKKSYSRLVLKDLGQDLQVDTLDQALPEMMPELKGQKFDRGVNKPFKSGEEYLVVVIDKILSLSKTEVKEGWFEEYFPDQKPKRKALYKKDVLIEEHVWNEAGQEIKTFGGNSSKGNEDDAMPSTGKKKTKKGKSGSTPAESAPAEGNP